MAALGAAPSTARAEGAPGAQDAQDAGAAEPGPDLSCLRWLDEHQVQFITAPPTRGIRTPIEVPGPIGSVTLFLRAGGATPHGRMDCELARALVDAAPVFRELGITDLVYSAAYDYRNRRGSQKLSEHANGLAIDVHAFNGPERSYSVEQDFETGVGEWLSLPRVGASLEACVGQPKTDAGRTLRTLACRLKLDPAFRVIVTRDDNEDHRDHFHLESYPDLESRNRRATWGKRARLAAPPATAAAHDTVAAAPSARSRREKSTHEKRRAQKKLKARSKAPSKTKLKKKTGDKRRGIGKARARSKVKVEGRGGKTVPSHKLPRSHAGPTPRRS